MCNLKYDILKMPMFFTIVIKNQNLNIEKLDLNKKNNQSPNKYLFKIVMVYIFEYVF